MTLNGFVGAAGVEPWNGEVLKEVGEVEGEGGEIENEILRQYYSFGRHAMPDEKLSWALFKFEERLQIWA